MNPTIRLTDQIPRIIQKIVFEIAKEEIVPDDFFRERQLALGGFEIELDVEFFEERGDGVVVLVFLHLDDFDHFLDRVADAGG
jgi:hypothetical protein